MKGLTTLGVGCALFLATQASVVDAAEETLQNYGEGLDCANGQPIFCPTPVNTLVECFDNAQIAEPFQLTEATYSISAGFATPEVLDLVVYDWSGTGAPLEINRIAMIPLSGADLSTGDHTIVLDSPVPLPSRKFCVGLDDAGSANGVAMMNLPANILGLSYARATGCGLTDFLDTPSTGGGGNWCVTATIEEEVVDTTVEVDIDIKFCDDPNSFNCKKKGALPVTIFGTDSFDVAEIDVSTLRLCLADLTTCTGAPKDWSSSDRGNPLTDIGADMCAINVETGLEEDFLNQDGHMDLDVAFEASEVKETLLVDFCNSEKNAPSPTLFVVGTTFGGDTVHSMPLDDVAVDQLRKANK